MFTQYTFSQDKQVTHQSQYWLKYDNTLKFSDTWSLETEIEDRRFLPDRQDQLLIPRITLKRNLGDGWGVGLGFAFVLQSLPQTPDEDINLTRPEYRPYQDVYFKHILGTSKFQFSERFRLEERITRNTSGDNLAQGSHFNFRVRYRLQLAYPIIKKENDKGTVTLKTSDEVMLNFGPAIVQNTFDQNRLGGSVNYSFSKNLQLQIDYINLYQQRSSGFQFFNRNILRLTVYHTIHWRKKTAIKI